MVFCLAGARSRASTCCEYNVANECDHRELVHEIGLRQLLGVTGAPIVGLLPVGGLIRDCVAIAARVATTGL